MYARSISVPPVQGIGSLTFGWSSGTRATSTSFLNGRALDRAIRTEDTTVARLRGKQGFAPRAFIEIDASVSRHHFDRHVSAMRAGQRGLKHGRRHFHCSHAQKGAVNRQQFYRQDEHRFLADTGRPWQGLAASRSGFALLT